MARPRSPHMPSNLDLAGGFGTDRVSQDVFCTPHPPHAQDSLSPTSSRSSVEFAPFTTVTSEPVSSPTGRTLTEGMEAEGPLAMHWTVPSDLSTDHACLSNSNYHMSGQLGLGSGDFFSYAQNDMSYNDNYDIPYASQYPGSSFPQSYHGININSLSRDVDISESYPPAMYQIEPPKHYDAVSDHGVNDHLMQMRDDYEQHYGSHIKREEHAGYNSPYSDSTRASTPGIASPMYDLQMTGRNDAMIDKEQPYAQLIYQALLQADGHTMILRDIYDWFVKHTDKAAASETKGWQNSIRHNLSMNGAFEKVDQPCEESRKGFMWRLTEEALRAGVKSTTRYRSKQPTKRGNRMQHPQPQRQASGAKGGQAARRSANVKRFKRMHEHLRSEPYVARSVPATFDPVYTHAHNLAYPPSSYYGSDIDYISNSNHNKHTGLEFFSPTQSVMTGDGAYVLAQSPSESLFTDSPTPSAEEPRTPGWGQMELGASWEKGDVAGMGLSFQEYAG